MRFYLCFFLSPLHSILVFLFSHTNRVYSALEFLILFSNLLHNSLKAFLIGRETPDCYRSIRSVFQKTIQKNICFENESELESERKTNKTKFYIGECQKRYSFLKSSSNKRHIFYSIPFEEVGGRVQKFFSFHKFLPLSFSSSCGCMFQSDSFLPELFLYEFSKQQ